MKLSLFHLQKYFKPDDFIDLYHKFEINKQYNKKQLKKLYYNIGFTGRDILINRDKFLKSSIKSFKNIKTNYIRVRYKNEIGIDCGGLVKDWFTTAVNELQESGIFKLVPNGTSLTIDEDKIDLKLIYFTGKLIGSALTNKRNINLQFTTFIWKLLLNEQITLEDMKYYDIEIYKSLKWISENDPESSMLTFVNIKNEELCPNGKNIDVTEENKKEYIKLQIKNIFLRKKEIAFHYLLEEFKETTIHEILIDFIDFNV